MNLTRLTLLWPPFGAGAGGTTPEEAPDLLAAIQDAFNAGGPTTAFPDGLETVTAIDGTEPPHALLAEEATMAEFRSDTRDVFTVTLRMNTLSADLDETARLGKMLDDWLMPNGKGIRFTFTGGSTSPLVRLGEPRRSRDYARFKGGRSAWKEERRYTCRVTRPKG